MKSRDKFLLTCVMGVLIIGAGPMLPEAHAADAAMPTKAMPAAEPVPFWWFHGEVEVGGRFFLNDPQKNGIASQGGKSLGKFYEYRDLRPGPFGNAHLATGTNNGLYQIDVWAKNIGYDDQRFDLRASKAGEHYFNFQWDETPHNYGTGHTIYNGVGSTALTLPTGLSNTLGTACNPATNCTGPVQNATAAAAINANLHDIDMGIRRDTAAVDYRWTPTDAWDIKTDYSNMHRTGTQTDGVTFSFGTSGVRVDAPKPVDDVTQNYGLNGEYAGTSPWGKKFNLKLAYNGSTYTDGDKSYSVQNPFCITGATTCDSTSSPLALMSLWPNNHVNGFSSTLGADLPANSRYMGTISYNMMRQNDNFLPFTNNPNLGNNPSNGLAWTSPAVLGGGYNSLNGQINTLMSNNVLTTQITPDLKSKLSYRYYDFNNETPEINVPNWIGADINQGGGAVSPSQAQYRNLNSISISYVKQNAGAQLDWRPINSVNVGAAYGYERYDWNRADVNTTNENSGKVFGDWKPFTWVTARASWEYSVRRYDTYNYLGNVGAFQWNGFQAAPLINCTAGINCSTQYSTAYRQFYLDNRDRNKARFSVSVDVMRNLTVTPTFGLQYDNFKLNQATEVGLLNDRAWNAGVDLSYVMSPQTKLLLAYMYENRSQVVSSAGSSVPPFPAASYYTSNVEDKIHTFIAALDQNLIPNKLDLRLGYTVSFATTSQPLYFANGTIPTAATGGQYPDMKDTFQRFEATAKYNIDEDFVRRMGWNGKVVAKLGYAYERNSVANWQLDDLMPYTGGAPYCSNAAGTTFSCGFMLWLANDNPNYNVHQLVASLTFKW
jgi:MtrB/PioB family decaheme-associated outer membrane protein